MQKFYFVQELANIHNLFSRTLNTFLNEEAFISVQMQKAEAQMPDDGWDGALASEFIQNLHAQV